MDRDLKTKYNLRSPSVKRLMREAMELREPNNQYHAQPLEDNLFEWHFTVKGPPDSDFDSGRYHGRIILPPEYPMKPPSIMLLTPNGRFETGKKICLSMSAHHPEGWQPSWSIRTVLLALIGFMPSKGGGAIGALDYTKQERGVLAQRSANWTCDVCQTSNVNLLPAIETTINEDAEREAKELASQIDFKGESKGENGDGKTKPMESTPQDATSHPQLPPNIQQPQPRFPPFYNSPYFQYQMPPQPSGALPYGFPSRFQLNQPHGSAGAHSSQSQGPASTQPSEMSQEVESVSSRDTALTASDETEHNPGSGCSSQAGSNQTDQPDAALRQRPVSQRGTSLPSALSDFDRRTRRRTRDNDGGYLSLVMLWIVTISLVALILRRLCMEALNLNPQG